MSYTHMGFDSVMQQGHWEFTLSHHHTIWILLYCTHLVLKLLEGRLLDHPCICWITEDLVQSLNLLVHGKLQQ